MITRERLERIRSELVLDNDTILGKDKEAITASIDLAIAKYRAYEVRTKLVSLESKIRRFCVKNVPEEITDEAICIVADMIDRDCQEEHIKIEWLSDFQADYCIHLLDKFNETPHNCEIVNIAFGKKPYIADKSPKLRKVRFKPSEHNFDKDLTDDEVDWDNEKDI